MKRFLLILTMLALVLAGCGSDVPDATGDTTLPQTTTVPETTVAVEGLYDPASSLTEESGGALRAYPLGDLTCSGMMTMGDGILLFYTDNVGDSSVALVTGDEGVITAETELGCVVTPGGNGLLVTDDSLVYYDSLNRALVTLDEKLQETDWVEMPEDMVESPLISSDGQTVYYCAGTQIRALDLQEGISRLVREQSSGYVSLSGLYCDDTVLKVYVQDEDASIQTQYLSTENGEVIHYGDDTYMLYTEDDRFYAELGGDYLSELLYGEIGGEVKVLEPVGIQSWTQWLPAMHGAVNCTANDGSWTLNYYDLSTGLRTSSLTMSDAGTVWNVLADPAGAYVWFLYYSSESDEEILCRWDLEKSAVGDGNVYTDRRYTAADPDLEGIADCQAEAVRISEKYGVEILLWEDALQIQPLDYTFEAEYRVALMEQGLRTLDEIMARYPAGFFQTAAELSDYGKIRVCLIGGLYGGETYGSLNSADGIQYWIGNDPYIALRLIENLEMNFYHEMLHVIETRVLNETVIYDDWENLNPRGFEYDYDYIANLGRTDTTYLEGEDRAFIDFYSMSYPKEDRARIMEYAMMEGNEDFFASDWMQRKLLRLCRGIRRAFGLSKHPEVLPWEQYLEDSLVPD